MINRITGQPVEKVTANVSGFRRSVAFSCYPKLRARVVRSHIVPVVGDLETKR